MPLHFIWNFICKFLSTNYVTSRIYLYFEENDKKFEYSMYRYSLIRKHFHSNYLFTFQNDVKTQSYS